MKNIYVLSDIHLGTDEKWDWFDYDQKEGGEDNEVTKALIKLLRRTIAGHKNPETVELVLAGDIFDTWLTPPGHPRRTIQQILDFKGNQKILDAISECIEKVSAVYYMNGNHDMHVTAKDLERLNRGDKKIRFVENYKEGGVYITHGHEYTMYNAKDTKNGGKEGLPIGYYITRMGAHSQRNNKDHDFSRVEFALRVGKQKVASFLDGDTETEQTLSAMAGTVDLEDSTDFLNQNNETTITLADVKKDFKNLYEDWCEEYTEKYVDESIKAEVEALTPLGYGSLDYFADLASVEKGCPVVVMGHTHICDDDKDIVKNANKNYANENRIYANAGGWIDSVPTYVLIKETEEKFQVIRNIWQPTKVFARRYRSVLRENTILANG